MSNYRMEDMSCGRGIRIRYTFEDKNAKGEEITVELVSCTRDPGSRSPPILWKKQGLIDRVLDTWVGVNVYVTSRMGHAAGPTTPRSPESGIKSILIGCLKTRRKTETALLRKFAAERLRR